MAIGVEKNESRLGLFDDLPPAVRAGLEDAMAPLRLPAGAVIFTEGDASDALYVVRAGLVDVVAEGPTGPRRLVTVGPGETIGEQSLLTGQPRNASAIAQTGVTLWRLDHLAFVAALAAAPELAATVGRLVAGRLQAANRQRLGFRRGQSVVIWARRRDAAAATARQLVSACRELLGEEPLVLARRPKDRRAAPPVAGCELVEQAELPGAAVRAVRDHALVLVLAGPGAPVALVQGADQLVRIGDAPRRAPVREPRPRDQVLATVPDPPRAAALARAICGRRVGLALGSGGVRGFAHAGVLAVLEEEGIPIDVVSGASAGAIAGALFLSGVPPREMADLASIAREVLRTGLPSLSLSPRSLLPGRRLLRYLRSSLGSQTRIEDLPTPLVVATTDLASLRAVHLDSGPLAEAVAASAAMPGIFPPVRLNGRQLVDGGAADPVPVDALRERDADIVVAVNIMSLGNGLLGMHLPRLRLPLPPVVANLYLGLDTVMTQISGHACRRADVVVEPTKHDPHWYDVLPAPAYMRAGEEAMRAAVPKIRALLSGARAI